MSRQPLRRTEALTVEAIVGAAAALVAEHGLAALSMRRLGDALGVDPMAVYHHVPNKRALLSLLTARAVGAMPVPDPDRPWDERVRAWALGYWDVVVANRELVLAGLADPAVAAGGVPLSAPLVDAVADSGLAADLVEANAWLVVDVTHGSAVAAGAPLRHAIDDLGAVRVAFASGLDTIVAGIAARAAPGAGGRRAGRARRP